MLKQESVLSKVFKVAVVVLLMCLLFNACSFIGWPSRLESPTLTVSGSVATWTNVLGADSYSLYDGETKIADIEPDSGSTTSHDFISNINTTISSHYISVVAKGDGYFDSNRSNQVAYTYVAQSEYDNEIDTSSLIIDNSGLNAPQNLIVSNGQLSWDVISGVDSYYVCFYMSGTDSVTVSVDGNSVYLSTLFGSSTETIISVRVGALVGGKLCYGNTVLYNKESHGDYSEVFVFGKVLGDYHITGIDELTEICYFAFINRLDEINIQFSGNPTGIANAITVGGITDALTDVFGSGAEIGGFYETMSVNYQVSQASGSTSEYSIEFSYSDIDSATNPYYEPTITSSNVYATEYTTLGETQVYYGYYESSAVTTDDSLTARTSTFNAFASDSFERVIEVKTSEELYWAIENGFTPTFPNTTCSAYLIYNEAKDILIEIIYEGMTDYQKARSIFDWICLNTVYDYDETGLSSIGVTANNNNIKCRAYYLEGVIEDGLAVCDGFSKTFSLLCNMEGIDCYRVVGTANGGGHAWNKVKIDENWYMCDITWTESSSSYQDGLQTKLYEYLAHSYFLLPDDSYHDEFTSAYTTAFQKDNSATSYYNYWDTKFINADLLVNNLKLNDVIEFLFNDSVGGTIDETTSANIKDFIYNGEIPGFDNRRDYTDLFSRVITLMEMTYGGNFENYIAILLSGDYAMVKSAITVENIVSYLNTNQSAGLTTDYSLYYLDENRDFVVKDAEDFEILTMYVLYSGLTDIEVLFYNNYYVSNLFNTSGALQTAFDTVKANNPIFNIEFTDILGEYLNARTSANYVYGASDSGMCLVIELYDRTTTIEE